MIEKQQLTELGMIDNKYLDIYLALVNQPGNRHNKSVYTERHHIIPKCLNGDNDKENLVVLTFREHFIAHRLLVRCTAGAVQTKMRCAIQFFTACAWPETRTISSRMIDIIKIEGIKGQPLPEDVKIKMSIKKKSKWDSYTSEEREKIVAKIIETTQTDEINTKRKEGLKEFFSSPEGVAESDNRSKRRKEFLSDPDNLNDFKTMVSKSWDDPNTRNTRIDKIRAAAYGGTFQEAQKERWKKYWDERGGKPVIVRKSIPDEDKTTCPQCGKRVKYLSCHIKKHENGLLKKELKKNGIT